MRETNGFADLLFNSAKIRQEVESDAGYQVNTPYVPTDLNSTAEWQDEVMGGKSEVRSGTPVFAFGRWVTPRLPAWTLDQGFCPECQMLLAKSGERACFCE